MAKNPYGHKIVDAKGLQSVESPTKVILVLPVVPPSNPSAPATICASAFWRKASDCFQERLPPFADGTQSRMMTHEGHSGMAERVQIFNNLPHPLSIVDAHVGDVFLWRSKS